MISSTFIALALAATSSAVSQWQITSISNHFPAHGSGSTFNSTIDFNVARVQPKSGETFNGTHCHGTWANYSYPVHWQSCDDWRLIWRFKHSDYCSNCNFTLDLAILDGFTLLANKSRAADYLSEYAHVSSNHPQTPDSYLTCESCPSPWNGVCGTTNGNLSVPAPIPLSYNQSYDELFQPFYIPSVATFNNSAQQGVNFTFIDKNLPFVTNTSCAKTWRTQDVSSQPWAHLDCLGAKWAAQIVVPQGGDPLTNFVLNVQETRTESGNVLQGDAQNVTFSVSTALKVGQQLAGGCQGTSCSWALAPGASANASLNRIDL